MNVFQNYGTILKAVAAVLMKSAWGCTISHNSITNSPRAAIVFSSINMGLKFAASPATPYRPHVSEHNIIEHCIIANSCLETNDCGAIYAYGGGFSGPPHGSLGYDLNNTIRFVNITNVVGVKVCSVGAQKWQCREPRTCVQGRDTTVKGSPLLPCDPQAFAIYLDGGSNGGQGYYGATIYGNVLTASIGGAVFINGGGNTNVTNNLLLDGRGTQTQMPCYLNKGSQHHWGRGSSFTNNIFSFGLVQDFQNNGTVTDGGGDPFPVILSSNCLAQIGNTTTAGIDIGSAATDCPGCADPKRLAAMDFNIYWSTALDVATAPMMFPDLGERSMDHGRYFSGVPSNGTAWRAQRVTYERTDQHSRVADPLFVAPERGDYRLQPHSPAWALGWRELPPIAVPRRRRHQGEANEAAEASDSGG
jgi:hypothetical protein